MRMAELNETEIEIPVAAQSLDDTVFMKVRVLLHEHDEFMPILSVTLPLPLSIIATGIAELERAETDG